MGYMYGEYTVLQHQRPSRKSGTVVKGKPYCSKNIPSGRSTGLGEATFVPSSQPASPPFRSWSRASVDDDCAERCPPSFARRSLGSGRRCELRCGPSYLGDKDARLPMCETTLSSSLLWRLGEACQSTIFAQTLLLRSVSLVGHRGGQQTYFHSTSKCIRCISHHTSLGMSWLSTQMLRSVCSRQFCRHGR